MSLPADPFNRSRLPADFSREHRVSLLAEVAAALLEGREVPRTAALFVAGGLQAWLRDGGRLTRDYWKVDAPAGSHRTATALLASSRGATAANDCGKVAEPEPPAQP